MIGVEAFGLVGVDLADQDQGVAHQDSGQADEAKDRVKPEWLVEKQQDRNSPDQSQRRRQEHHGRGRERARLDDEDQ